MNLPNKLTMLRMYMIPLFLVFFFVETIPMHMLWALVVFAAASLTDLLDGNIARKRGLITDFGKLMDPLADKLLVTAALCCLLPQFGIIGIISLILILSREFLVTSIRLIAAGKGEVLAADIWGKIKTVVQMTWICMELLGMTIFPFFQRGNLGSISSTTMIMLSGIFLQITWIVFVLMVLLTVASGVHYVIKNRKLFADA